MKLWMMVAILSATTCATFAGEKAETTCAPMDLSKLAGYYTAADGSFVTLEFQPADVKLGVGQAKVDVNAGDKATSMAVPAGKLLVATTLCGGTKDCSSKSCQNANDSCKPYTRGCSCQSK